MEDRRGRLRTLSMEVDNLFDLGKREEAAALLQKAVAESEDDAPYRLFFLGEAAGYLEGNRGRQKKCFLQAYRLAENDPFMARNVGVFYLLNNSERKAIRFFEKALALDPNDHESARNKGLAFSNLGREKKGMEWFGKAIAMNPEDYDAMRQTGVSLSKLGKEREAVQWFRKALAVNEKDYDSMRQLGISLAMLGNLDAAVECLRLALAVNPNDFESKRNLSLVMKKISGEGETILSGLLVYLSRQFATFWRRLLNLL